MGADWPQWRGPLRSGHVPSGDKIPLVLPATPVDVWRLKVGEGLASPVVAAGTVFYFDAIAGKETLHAIEAASARELWQATVDDTFRDSQGPAGPRCTPVVDGDRVYALSCKGELQCRKTIDGSLLWHVNFTNELGAMFIGEKGNAAGAARHGNNGSPLVAGDRLYAQVGGTNGAGIVCFDKKAGTVIWKSQNDLAGYAPPIMAKIGGVEQVICFTADGLIGLRESDGSLLWCVPMKTGYGRHVTTPVVLDDIVVVASHQVGLIGTRIVKTDGGFRSEQAWSSKELAINFSSPVLFGKHLFGLGPAKNLICVEALTGKLAWSQDGYFNASADKAHASFIVLGENILTLTDGGELVLFRATAAEFKEVSRVQICAVNWCNPAYANGKLFVRDGIKTTGELLCLDLMPR